MNTQAAIDSIAKQVLGQQELSSFLDFTDEDGKLFIKNGRLCFRHSFYSGAGQRETKFIAERVESAYDQINQKSSVRFDSHFTRKKDGRTTWKVDCLIYAEEVVL